MPLTTKDLKAMSVGELEEIANTLGTRLLALDSLGKDETNEEFKRVYLELYHVDALITEKSK